MIIKGFNHAHPRTRAAIHNSPQPGSTAQRAQHALLRRPMPPAVRLPPDQPQDLSAHRVGGGGGTAAAGALSRHQDRLAGRYAVPDARRDLGLQLTGRPAGEPQQQAEVEGVGEAAAHHAGCGGQASKVDALL